MRRIRGLVGKSRSIRQTSTSNIFHAKTRRREDAKKKKEEKSGSKQETLTKFEVRRAKGENFTLPTSPSTFGARRPPATACATSGKAFRLLLRVFAASRANCPGTRLPEDPKSNGEGGKSAHSHAHCEVVPLDNGC